MPNDGVTTIFMIFSCAFVPFVFNWQYSDLEALGIDCPGKHRCGDNSELQPTRGCECDSACVTYRDCCTDVRRQPAGREAQAAKISCLHHGVDAHFGVYVVSSCSSNWNGPLQIKQNCEELTDFSDPINAVPVTSTVEGITYKNRYCAECNNADIDYLEKFTSKLSCEGVKDSTEELKMNQLSYNQQTEKWGIYRVDARGNTNFTACRLRFSLPRHLKRYVHLCRVNMVSECPRDWPRLQDQKLCKEYMAVVYDKDHVYRNPHCAICNNKTISELRCMPRRNWTPWRNRLARSAKVGGSSPPGGSHSTKKKPYTFTELLDMMKLININGICPVNHKFDPFFKRCRPLQCALPGYTVQKGRCVRGS